MQLERKQISVALPDGTQITIRPLVPRDAPALLAFYRALPEEDRLFLDDDVTQQKWIDRLLSRVDYDTTMPIIAELDGVIIGHATLSRTHYGWMSHVGQIRITVAHDWQRRGVGTALVRELIKIALSFGLEIMTARMMDNQAGAIHAFEKLGFKTEATFHHFVKDVNGKRRNMIIMANDVSHIWQNMENLVSDNPHSRDVYA